MLEIVRKVQIQAPAEVVRAICCDVERWHEWTESISGIKALDQGPFRVGARYRVSQPKLLPAVWTVEQIDPDRGFAWVSKAPLALARGEHWVDPRKEGGCEATLRLQFSGLVGVLIGRAFRKLSEHYVTLEAEGLRRRAESAKL